MARIMRNPDFIEDCVLEFSKIFSDKECFNVSVKQQEFQPHERKFRKTPSESTTIIDVIRESPREWTVIARPSKLAPTSSYAIETRLVYSENNPLKLSFTYDNLTQSAIIISPSDIAPTVDQVFTNIISSMKSQLKAQERGLSAMKVCAMSARTKAMSARAKATRSR